MAYSLTPINTVLLQQFQAWTDVYGMITNNSQGNSTDNGNLFTAHYVYGLVATNQIDEKEKQRILQVYANNFSQPQDDMYGLMSAEALLTPNDRKMTRSIYEYGLKSASGIDSTEPYQGAQTRFCWTLRILTLGRCRWVWNNIEPGKFDEASWLGRFPAFLAVMQMSLKEQVNPFFWAYWCISCVWDYLFGNSDDNNGDALMLHGAIAADGYGPLTNWICKLVHKNIKRKYGSTGVLMADYFQNPQHPLCQLLKDVD
jgi:hypothetical protein